MSREYVIECVDVVTIEETRVIREWPAANQESAIGHKANRCKKRPHADKVFFVYYDARKGECSCNTPSSSQSTR